VSSNEEELNLPEQDEDADLEKVRELCAKSARQLKKEGRKGT
jgi:hypothetical protein